MAVFLILLNKEVADLTISRLFSSMTDKGNLICVICVLKVPFRGFKGINQLIINR